MINRRKFIKNLAIGTAGFCATNSLISCNITRERMLGNIGYITGILGRNLRGGDWRAILKQTAEFGYAEIETGNYMGESAASFLDFCREVGLKPIAGGTRMTDDMDVLNQSLDTLNSLEMKYAVIYWPWLVGAPFTLDDCKISVDMLNNIGEVCKSRGLTLCWHNHDREFDMIEEGLIFDYIMDNTDEDLVKCELDIYWTLKGGADPVETLRKYPGRYPILHVKDMAPGEEMDFACPGEGIIDWPAVFSESADQGIKHYFVERDNAEDGLECLRVSAEYLKALKF